MTYLPRQAEAMLIQSLKPGKVVILLGARRTGKTVLLNQLTKVLGQNALKLNGEDVGVQEALERRSRKNYLGFLSGKSCLIIDEAPHIPDVGKKLKFLVDEFPEISFVVTGSSSLDLQTQGEPLVGRNVTIQLFPLSEEEIFPQVPPYERKDELHERLIFGSYPELWLMDSREQRANYLSGLVNDYLLRDLLIFEEIRNSQKLKDLLRLIAFQVGAEVSYDELGRQLGMSKNTVERYLDLLEKVFVIRKVSGFSRNLRKEISKKSRYYFLDNGIRNALIGDFSLISQRNDTGQLWENFLVSERIKYISYHRRMTRVFFWRTYDQQEIDWIEEENGRLNAFEFKWGSKKSTAPTAWKVAYPDSNFEFINPENYRTWLKVE